MLCSTYRVPYRACASRSAPLVSLLSRLRQALRGLDLLVDQIGEADLVLLGLLKDIDQGGAQIVVVRAAPRTLEIAYLRLGRRFVAAPVPDPEPVAIGPGDVVASVAGAAQPARNRHGKAADRDLLGRRIDRSVVTLQP